MFGQQKVGRILLKCSGLSCGEACKSCRSRQELSHKCLLANIGFDTAENGPLKVCQTLIHYPEARKNVRINIGSNISSNGSSNVQNSSSNGTYPGMPGYTPFGYPLSSPPDDPRRQNERRTGAPAVPKVSRAVFMTLGGWSVGEDISKL